MHFIFAHPSDRVSQTASKNSTLGDSGRRGEAMRLCDMARDIGRIHHIVGILVLRGHCYNNCGRNLSGLWTTLDRLLQRLTFGVIALRATFD